MICAGNSISEEFSEVDESGVDASDVNVPESDASGLEWTNLRPRRFASAWLITGSVE